MESDNGGGNFGHVAAGAGGSRHAAAVCQRSGGDGEVGRSNPWSWVEICNDGFNRDCELPVASEQQKFYS